MMDISLLAVPVLLDTDTEASHLVRQWVRLYHYGHLLMPAMAVTTLALYSYTACSRRATHQAWRIWAIAGLVTVTMVPFTWTAMTPTNSSLFQLNGQGGVIELRRAQELVVTWSRLHIARSMFPLVGAILGWMGMMGEV